MDQPSMTDRGRGVGDLGMAGLNIGAPARLQRGGRALPPTGRDGGRGGRGGNPHGAGLGRERHPGPAGRQHGNRPAAGARHGPRGTRDDAGAGESGQRRRGSRRHGRRQRH
ncbi:MAG: hypothetical protein ACK56F_31490 [bacterium]